MSDTIELWELCPHGLTEKHSMWKRTGTDGKCEGGTKRVFQQQEARAATSYLVWVEVADE